MNRVEPVGGGDEEHLRQVKRHVEIMIGEGVVLLRVEHFEQRGRGITAKIRADLVDLVEEDDGVAAFDAAQTLNDASGHRADVGAAVAADFRLVAQTAERDACELATERVGHAFAERGLADAGRAGEAEDRAFEIVLELDDGEKFQQPLLHFLQAEMLFVENFGRGFEVDFILGRFVPRQVQQPVEVVAGDGVFGDGGRHLLQPFQLLEDDFLRLFGEWILLKLFAQGVDLGGGRIALAQLALDGADLFAQKKITLAFGHRVGDLVLDFRAERGDFQLAVEQGTEPVEAFDDVVGFDQALALFEIEVHVASDQIAERAGRVGVERGDANLLRNGRRQLDDLLKFLLGVAGERGRFHRIADEVFQHLDLRAQVGRLAFVILDADAPDAFNENAHGVVGKFQHLQNARGAAVFPQIFRAGIIHVGLALQHQPDHAVAFHHVIHQLDALGGLDQQRRDHAGKNHDVGKAENGQRLGNSLAGQAGHGSVRSARRTAGRGTENIDKFCFGGTHRECFDTNCLNPSIGSETGYPLEASNGRFFFVAGTACGTSTRRKPFW